MRLLYTLAAVLMAALALAACNSNDPKGNSVTSKNTPVVPAAPADKSAHVAPSDGVKRVTTVELRDALDKGTAIVIDVRPAQTYSTAHIKGSINIPLDQVPSRLKELPRDKMIVTYCSWPNEHTSARAVQIMQEQGIQNAAALLGGTHAWESAGLPMENAVAQ